jgi:hypothetical protein
MLTRIAAALAAAAGFLATAQPAQRWHLAQDLRVGTADGAVPYTFSLQAQVVSRNDGTLYVLDRGNHEVRVFDTRGRHLRTFGREGAGPGEFLGAATAGWVADTLWVSDPLQLRTTFFAPDGRVLRTAGPAIRASREFAPAAAEAVLADGSLLVLPSPLQPASRTAVIDVSRLPVLRVGRSGTVDTLAHRDLRNRMVRVSVGASRLMLLQPWDDSPLLAVATNGQSIVMVTRPAAVRPENARFRVTRLTPTGDTAFSRSFLYTPVPVPPGWASTWADETARVISARRGNAERNRLTAALSQGAYVPKFMPPVTAVVAADDGTVWLRREARGAVVAWTVLGPNGLPLADVRAPSGLEIQQVQRSHVSGVMTDALDVPYVYRYRIQRQASR